MTRCPPLSNYPALSVVVPCYNEESCLPLFLPELARAAKRITCEHPGATIELYWWTTVQAIARCNYAVRQPLMHNGHLRAPPMRLTRLPQMILLP